MSLLKNFDINNQYWDLQIGKILITSTPNNLIGWYKNFKEIFSKLFVINNQLYFNHDGWEILIDDNINCILDKSKNSHRCLKFVENKVLLIEISYQVDLSYFGIPPFDYIEEEDFDWGLFVSNVINNKERKDSFIEYFSTTKI